MNLNKTNQKIIAANGKKIHSIRYFKVTLSSETETKDNVYWDKLTCYVRCLCENNKLPGRTAVGLRPKVKVVMKLLEVNRKNEQEDATYKKPMSWGLSSVIPECSHNVVVPDPYKKNEVSISLPHLKRLQIIHIDKVNVLYICMFLVSCFLDTVPMVSIQCICMIWYRFLRFDFFLL